MYPVFLEEKKLTVLSYFETGAGFGIMKKLERIFAFL